MQGDTCTLCQYWVDLEPVIKSTHRGEDERYYVIIQHRVFTVEPNWEDGTSRGSGGKEFVIRDINTKEDIVTTNLWFTGILPPAFWEKLPDTHIFIEGGEEYVRTS